MILAWEGLFDNFGVKKVSETDKIKAAYVLSAEQLSALASAQIEPSEERPAPPFEVTILFDPLVESVEASYYHSKRSEEAGRGPEPRLGRQIISSWMQIDDHIIIGNIGTRLYAAKLAAASDVSTTAAAEIAKKIDPDAILARARKATGKPGKAIRERFEFIRDANVVAGAIVRSNGACEMPGCGTTLFLRNDGLPFLEVHHIVPLAENGDDTLANAAALCPMCHRELHFGALRFEKREALANRINSLTNPNHSP
jgi:HNH endonuclease